MSKRAVGVWFCCLSVVLFLARYIFACWLGTGGGRSFSGALYEIGNGLWVAAAMFLAAGFMCVYRAENEK